MLCGKSELFLCFESGTPRHLSADFFLKISIEKKLEVRRRDLSSDHLWKAVQSLEIGICICLRICVRFLYMFIFQCICACRCKYFCICMSKC